MLLRLVLMSVIVTAPAAFGAAAPSDLEQLFNWTGKFHESHFDMANALPAHEAWAAGLTDDGEVCHFGVFHEGGVLELALQVTSKKSGEVNIGGVVGFLDTVSPPRRLRAQGGNIELEFEDNGNGLSIRGTEDGLVREVTGTSSASPKGITCRFQGVPTS